MRIGFMGKGGSGKSTFASMYAVYANREMRPVLAIDADVNMHLAELLEVKITDDGIGLCFDKIAEYLEPAERFHPFGMQSAPRFGTIIPNRDSRFVRVTLDDYVIRTFGNTTGKVPLLSVGKNNPKDLGATCYHSKLNALELILHHLMDGPDDRVVVDSAAGTDSLGTSLYLSYDLVVFAVEPSNESLAVFHDYKERTAGSRTILRVVANKIDTPADLKYIQDRIEPNELIGALPFSNEVRKLDQGSCTIEDCITPEVLQVFATIEKCVAENPRDWNRYQAELKDVFDRECLRWWNGVYSTDVRKCADDSFNYGEVQFAS